MIDEAIRAALKETLRAELPAALAEALEEQAGAGAELLTKQKLARRLNVSARTVDTLRQHGLPTVWVVESPRFEFAACVEWLRQRTPGGVK